jgi:NAD(P)-dependent dehydrogenase (short-subunit alcohol dehydrogenase family)
VLAARRVERLTALAADLPDALVVGCDLSEAGQSAALVDAALEHYGRVDVLVNNAGIDHTVLAVDESVADFRRELDVNLVAPFELARLVARSVMERADEASIVNVASIWALAGIGQIPDAGYAASKGGLVSMTRELAAQWARRGVRVNALAPGFFRTEMTEDRMFGDERSEAWLGRRTPMGRGGAEHELDGALLFLASPASSFVTGVVLAVDGGWTAT